MPRIIHGSDKSIGSNNVKLRQLIIDYDAFFDDATAPPCISVQNARTQPHREDVCEACKARSLQTFSELSNLSSHFTLQKHSVVVCESSLRGSSYRIAVLLLSVENRERNC